MGGAPATAEGKKNLGKQTRGLQVGMNLVKFKVRNACEEGMEMG